MDETISTLRIEIGASSENAKREIDRFSQSLKSLRGHSKQTIRVDSKDVDKANKKVSALSKTLSALKRIAFYRVIRSAIKAVTDAIQEGTENAYWYSKTVGESTRYISQAFDNMSNASFKMKNQIGAAWATLIATLEPIILKIIELITKAANVITQFFAILGGKTTYLKAVDYSKDWATTTEKGAKAAKEWKNQLLGFDEINRLEEPSSSDTGGAGASMPDYGSMFEEAEVDSVFQRIAEKFRELKDSLDFGPIQESISRLKGSISSLGETIINGLGWAWDNILVPFAHWTIEDAAPVLIDLLASAFDYLNSVLNKLAPVFQFVWDNILKPIANWAGDRFLDWISSISSWLNRISDVLSGKMTLGDFISSLDGKDAVIMAVAIVLGTLAAKALLLTAAGAAVTVFKVALAALTSPVTWVVAALTLLVETFTFVWQKSEKFRDAMGQILEGVKTIFKGFKDIIVGFFTLDADLVGRGVAEFMQGGKDIIEGLWKGIKEAWNVLKENWKEFWDKLVSDFKSFFGIHSPSTLFESFGTYMIEGLWNGIQAQWNNLTGLISSLWATFADWWGSLSLAPFHVPRPVFEWGSRAVDGALASVLNFFGLPASIPTLSISWMAKGGIVDGATLIGAGEAGKEAIIPLERNTEWISKVAAEMNQQQMKQDGGDNVEAIRQGVFEAVMAAFSMQEDREPITPVVKVYLDSREIKSGQKRLDRAMGVS